MHFNCQADGKRGIYFGVFTLRGPVQNDKNNIRNKHFLDYFTNQSYPFSSNSKARDLSPVLIILPSAKTCTKSGSI